MKRSLVLPLTVALLLVTGQRLFAPIQEVPESPTPAAEEQISKSKHSKAKRTNEETEAINQKETERAESPKAPPKAAQKRFAGTWSGIMPEVPWGNVATDLIVDASETTMQWRASGESKTSSAPATLSGVTLSARFPAGFTTAVWYISPHPDGTTADVRLTAFMNDQRAVFQRTSTATTSAPIPAKPQKPEMPTAKAVPGKPGFVYNPFDSNANRLLDVRGKPSGAKVKDPVSGKLFVVP